MGSEWYLANEGYHSVVVVVMGWGASGAAYYLACLIPANLKLQHHVGYQLYRCTSGEDHLSRRQNPRVRSFCEIFFMTTWSIASFMT